MKLRGMKCLQISGMKGEREQSGKKGVNAVKAKHAKSKITKHSAIIIIYKKIEIDEFHCSSYHGWRFELRFAIMPKINN